MIFGVIGCLAFGLFVVYDINSVNRNHRIFHSLFGVGCFLFLISNIGLLSHYFTRQYLKSVKSVIFVLLAIVFLALLIYTLFFALPFQETYIKEEGQPKVYDKGMYALCRHPGVLWLFFFYIFSSMAMRSREMIMWGCIYSVLNLCYVIFQDYYTFEKCFSDYTKYKTYTPFLIPNRKSIMRCKRTW